MSRDIEAGRAFIKLALTGRAEVQRGLKGLISQIRSVGAVASKITSLLGGVTIGAGFVASIKAASDMQETLSAFNVVFDQSSAAVESWSNTFADAVGRSRKNMLDFLTTTKSIFNALGFSSEEADEMSKSVTRLAVDLASFRNMADDDVLRDLQAALTGQGESMRKYGVVLNETRVKQELLDNAINPKSASEAQKTWARFNIILRSTTDAQGDAIREGDNFANQMKRAKANLDNFLVTLGNNFIPSLSLLLTQLNDCATAFRDMEVAGTNMGLSLQPVFDGLLVNMGALKGTALAIGAAFKLMLAGMERMDASAAIKEAQGLDPDSDEHLDALRRSIRHHKNSVKDKDDADKMMAAADRALFNFKDDIKASLDAIKAAREEAGKQFEGGPAAVPPPGSGGLPSRIVSGKKDWLSERKFTFPGDSEVLSHLRSIVDNTTRMMEMPDAVMEGTIEAARAAEANDKVFTATKQNTEILKEMRAIEKRMAAGIERFIGPGLIKGSI